MLALSPSLAYIHEPFNPYHRPGICKARFPYWFTHVCDENEAAYLTGLQDCLRFRYHFAEELKSIRSVKDSLRLSRDFYRFSKYRLLGKRPLVKDPIAIFSAEWLAQRFHMDVIVLIRHPADFAGSLEKAQWTHPFDHFVRQPLLMRHHLGRYRSDIETFSTTDHDIVGQAILLWNVIHHMILQYRDMHPEWIFAKHEELSQHPIEQFRRIYDSIGLHFSPRIQRIITQHSFADPTTGDSDPLRRDSRSNVRQWHTRLTPAEIDRIREHTHQIAEEFYTDADWLDQAP